MEYKGNIEEHMNKTLGYKVFKDLDAFITWQGEDINPNKGTVNAVNEYRDDLITIRYTYPEPHPTATWEEDKNGLPIKIAGENVKVCALIDSNCPEKKIPKSLKTIAEVRALGWFPIQED